MRRLILAPAAMCPPVSTLIFHWRIFVSSAKPQWIQTMKDTALAIEERLYWECRANGRPKPSYTWLKNGQQLLSEVNYPQTFHFKDFSFSLCSSFHLGEKHAAVFPSAVQSESVNILSRCASVSHSALPRQITQS